MAQELISTQSGRLSANRVGDGTVNNTKLGYLANVTSDIQDQLDNVSVGTGSITTAKLATNSVTRAKLATGLASWELIEDFTATGSISTKTFTFDSIDFTEDSMLVLVIGALGDASLSYQLRLNGLSTSIYFRDGARIIGGSETILDENSNGQYIIASSTIINAASRPLSALVYIIKNNSNIALYSVANSSSTPANEICTGLVSTTPTLTSVTVFTSTGNISVNSKMALYRVKTV